MAGIIYTPEMNPLLTRLVPQDDWDMIMEEQPLILPDTDLHAISADGRHVGVNYETGEFENEIAGSIVSGDLSNDHEWILLPAEGKYQFFISAYDNRKFLEHHPEAAAKASVTDKTQHYTIYAKITDAEGIYPSEKQQGTVLDQDIYYAITDGRVPPLSK